MSRDFTIKKEDAPVNTSIKEKEPIKEKIVMSNPDIFLEKEASRESEDEDDNFLDFFPKLKLSNLFTWSLIGLTGFRVVTGHNLFGFISDFTLFFIAGVWIVYKLFLR